MSGSIQFNKERLIETPKISTGKEESLSQKVAKRELTKSVRTDSVNILRDFNSLSYCDLSEEFSSEFPDYISEFTSKSIKVFGVGMTLQLAAIYNLPEIAQNILSSPGFLKEISASELAEAHKLALKSGSEEIHQLIRQCPKSKEISDLDKLDLVDLLLSPNVTEAKSLNHLNLEIDGERLPVMMLSNAYCMKKFGQSFFKELCVKFS